MSFLRLLALLLFLSVPTLAQNVDFPNPPLGQVLDTGAWLGKERSVDLELELGRIRRAYGIDVMVVTWTRPLPSEGSLEDLARRVGDTWAREGLWAVVLYAPDSLEEPAVAVGGPVAETLKPEIIATSLEDGSVRGMKERTVEDKVKAVGLEVAEELVFLRNRRTLEQAALPPQNPIENDAKAVRNIRMVVLAVVVAILSLGALASVAYFFLRHRRPSEFNFPETRWRQRLGGNWSGGSHISVSIPTKS